MSYLYVTATVLAVYCLAAGSILPPWWQMSANALAVEKIILYSARFALSLALPKTVGTSGIKIKKGFLFCSPLGLHYLCPHILIR